MDYSKIRFFKSIVNIDKNNFSNEMLISPIFYRHSLENLLNFKNILKYFRLVAAYGGHENDGDKLKIKIKTSENFFKEDFEIFLSNTMKNNPYLFYKNDSLSFSISGSRNGDPYILDEEDFLVAKKIETYLQNNNIAVIDPPEDSSHCFCPKYYPDLF